MPKRWFALSAAVAASLAVVGCTGGCEPKPRVTQRDDGTPHVRVRVLSGLSRVTLTVDQRTPVNDATSGRPVAVGLQPGRTNELALVNNVWQDGTHAAAGVVLRIDPSTDGGLAVNGMPYRGAINLVPTGPGTFDVVNDVDVESYLQGVLAKELLADWQPEAYRAQAVIARTYALYEAKTNPSGRSWDLLPDERSQVYGGMKAESAKANAAVQATRGMVAAYGPDGQERIFKAYFSACCGGISASAADVFNEPAIPPLAAKSTGTTCAISPRYAWPVVVLSKNELARRFRTWGAKSNRAEAKMPGVKSIDIGSVNAFGRPRSYLVTDTRGQQYSLTSEQLRWAVNTDPDGGPTVSSGFFKPVDAGDTIRFTEGHGFGHGVGACQWCMQARALAGESYDKIVLRAFPQAVLVRAY